MVQDVFKEEVPEEYPAYREAVSFVSVSGGDGDGDGDGDDVENHGMVMMLRIMEVVCWHFPVRERGGTGCRQGEW